MPHVQDSAVQGPVIQSQAAMDVPECPMCVAAFRRVKAAADRLESHHRPKIQGSAKAQVEREWRWVDWSDQAWPDAAVGEASGGCTAPPPIGGRNGENFDAGLFASGATCVDSAGVPGIAAFGAVVLGASGISGACGCVEPADTEGFDRSSSVLRTGRTSGLPDVVPSPAVGGSDAEVSAGGSATALAFALGCSRLPAFASSA